MNDSVSLKKYLETIIKLNDRRYSEVNIEKEKALKIKEEADKIALGLARNIQTYKDEKANELRSQIEGERGLYLTREEYDAKHQTLQNQLNSIQRIIWIGTGILLAVEFLLKFFIHG